jgi:hypothetical protein
MPSTRPPVGGYSAYSFAGLPSVQIPAKLGQVAPLNARPTPVMPRRGVPPAIQARPDRHPPAPVNPQQLGQLSQHTGVQVGAR